MSDSSPELRDAVREAYVTVLEGLLGPDAATPLGDEVCPIGNLGIVSAEGMGLAAQLADLLGIKIPHGENPLVDDKKRQARTIGQTVDWLSQLVDERPN